ncbi:extracellular solute-binding protein [Streptomyces himalayensis]|uniref:extracellular solute-binding protein n=1 Tax=Streptomyces himalayensis TaxID=2820085 RepID=UPI00406B9EEF
MSRHEGLNNDAELVAGSRSPGPQPEKLSRLRHCRRRGGRRWCLFLTACGSSDSGKREGATSDKAAKKLLPAFVASSVAEPDIPAKNGSAAGFTSKVDLDALATSVPDKLGTGAPLKIMSPLWGAAPKGNCAYYTQLDKIAGTNITWQNQDGNTYGEKLGAVLASSSIPDMMVVPGWELEGKIANAITRKFMDLSPYLVGDKVKKYPNLAAIPTDAWKMGIFGGALRGIPTPSPAASFICPFYRKDIFEDRGYEVPTSTDEFMAWAKDATSAKAKVYACGDLSWTAANIFGVGGSGSLGWNMEDGKLKYRIERPNYLEALEWSRKLFAAGVVHPDDKARSGDPSVRFAAGEVLMYNNGHVTLPAMRPVIALLLVLRVGDALSVGFEQFLLQRDAVGAGVSEVLDTYVWNVGIHNGDFSYAAAVGLVKGVIGICLVLGANKFSHLLGEQGVYKK